MVPKYARVLSSVKTLRHFRVHWHQQELCTGDYQIIGSIHLDLESKQGRNHHQGFLSCFHFRKQTKRTLPCLLLCMYASICPSVSACVYTCVCVCRCVCVRDVCARLCQGFFQKKKLSIWLHKRRRTFVSRGQKMSPSLKTDFAGTNWMSNFWKLVLIAHSHGPREKEKAKQTRGEQAICDAEPIIPPWPFIPTPGHENTQATRGPISAFFAPGLLIGWWWWQYESLGLLTDFSKSLEPIKSIIGHLCHPSPPGHGGGGLSP